MKYLVFSILLALPSWTLATQEETGPQTQAARRGYLQGLVERYARRFEVLQDSACFVEASVARIKPRAPEALAKGLMEEWDAYFGDPWLQTLKDLRADLEGATADAPPTDAEQQVLALDALLRADTEAVKARLRDVLGGRAKAQDGAAKLLAGTHAALTAARSQWGLPPRSLDPGPTARAEVYRREGAAYVSQSCGFRCDLPKDWKLSTLGIDPWQRLRLRPPDKDARMVIALRVESFPDAASAEGLYRAIEHRAHEEWQGYRRSAAEPFKHEHWSGGYRLRFVLQQPKESQHGLAVYLHDADVTRTTGLMALGTQESLQAHQAAIDAIVHSLRRTE